jgi:excisionase family DNA binding protein
MVNMEKICIVKRRVRDGEPAFSGNERTDFFMEHRPRSREIEPSIGEPSPMTYAAPIMIDGPQADAGLSIELTPTQAETVRSYPYFKLLVGAAADESGIAINRARDGKIALNLQLKQIYVSKMLTTHDVGAMLQVSKGFVSRLVKSGDLKSYKIGRLRRFSLEDVLSLLDGSKEFF